MLSVLHQRKLATLALLAAPLLAQADARYTLTVVGGAGSVAYDVNNAGEVVGSLMYGTGSASAFLYSGSTLTDLGAFGASEARHINDLGQVVGTAAGRAFVYSGGAMSTLPSANYSGAYGINNSGTIVGTFGVNDGTGFYAPRAYSYSGGSFTDMGVFPDMEGSYGYAINNAGQATGAAFIAGPPNRPTDPFLYQDGMLNDIGNMGGVWSYGYSINDHAQIVGSGGVDSDASSDLYPRRAFLYDGAMHNLGSLGPAYSSHAYDINNHGQIVGLSDSADGNHAFLYEGGAMVDLNLMIDPASGWTIRDAQAINDVQQIAGTACKGELCYAVRLDLALAVPEPESWGMLLAGCGLIGAIVRVRRRRAKH